RAAGEPAAAHAANPSCDDTPAIRGFLQQPRLAFRQPERSVRYRDGQREGAAGEVLTISAVTGVRRRRRLADLIAQRAAEAAAGQGQLHRSVPSRWNVSFLNIAPSAPVSTHTRRTSCRPHPNPN